MSHRSGRNLGIHLSKDVWARFKNSIAITRIWLYQYDPLNLLKITWKWERPFLILWLFSCNKKALVRLNMDYFHFGLEGGAGFKGGGVFGVGEFNNKSTKALAGHEKELLFGLLKYMKFWFPHGYVAKALSPGSPRKQSLQVDQSIGGMMASWLWRKEYQQYWQYWIYMSSNTWSASSWVNRCLYFWGLHITVI